jgi:signal transduction histidine kinase/streptogramin lyase
MRRFLTFLLLLCAVSSEAQGYGFGHFTMNEGLSQNTVTCMLKDSEGFLWVGTQEGLNRYDGYRFQIFRNERGNNFSLPDNYVLSLFEDTRKNLWIASRNSISRYDRHTGRFIPIQVEGVSAFPATRFMFCESNSAVEILCGGIILRQKNDTVLELKQKTDFIPARFISPNTNGTEKLKRFTFEISPGNIVPLKGVMNSPSLSSGLKEIYFLTDSALNFYSTPEKKLYTYEFPDGLKEAGCLTVTANQRVWIGSRAGLYQFDRLKNTWNKITVPGSPQDRIESLYTDGGNITWIGTTFSGLYRYDPASELFAHPGELKISSPVTWTFCEVMPGELWTGTANGIDVFRKIQPGNSWPAIPAMHLTAVSFARPGLEELKGKTVTAILRIGQKVWIGTLDYGLYAYDLESGSIVHHVTYNPIDSSGLCHNSVLCLTASGKNENILYVGTKRGVTVVNTGTRGTRNIFPAQLSGNAVNNYVMSLYLEDTLLWIGTAKGLMRFHLPGESVLTFSTEANNARALPNNFICGITPDPQQPLILYLSTMGGGLIRFDTRVEEFTSFGKSQGLSSSTVYSAIADKKGRLWCSTNDGIAMMDRQTGLFEMFGAGSGIGSPEFSQNAYGKAADGTIFFGGAQGFVCFDPEKFISKPGPVQLVFPSIAINYRELPATARNISGSRTRPDRIELWPGDRVLTFEYAVAGSGGKKIRYRLKLEGFDEEWVDAPEGSRIATYTNLPAGEYILKVLALPYAGDSGASMYSVSVIVHPPFYATWWFRLLAVFFIAGIIVFTVRYFSQRKLRGKIREMQTQRRLQEERERISRDLHDNVGAQLTYIISTLDNVSWKMSKPGNTERPVEKIEALGNQARQTMQQLRESIWAINTETITAGDLGSKLREFMQQLGEVAEKITWEVNVAGESQTIQPAAAIQLFRIMQEATSNAFRHSGATNVSVNISCSEKQIHIEIQDNGKGFDVSKNHEGHYGLKNMPARAKQVGADFTINSGKDGTTISLDVRLET